MTKDTIGATLYPQHNHMYIATGAALEAFQKNLTSHLIKETGSRKASCLKLLL